MVSKGKHNDLPDKDILKKYLQGKLSPDEAHRIERLLLNNPLYQDALDGLETLNEGELEQDLNDLSQRIRKRSDSSAKGTSINFYRIAAAIILLAVFSYVIVYTISRMGPVSENETLSQKKEVLVEGEQDDPETQQPETKLESREEVHADQEMDITDTDPKKEKSDAAAVLSETSKDVPDKPLEESIDAADREESPEELAVVVTEESPKEMIEDEIENSYDQAPEEELSLTDREQDLDIQEEISVSAITDEGMTQDIQESEPENVSIEQEATRAKRSVETAPVLSEYPETKEDKRKENKQARQGEAKSIEMARTAAQPSPYSEFTTDEIAISVPVNGYENFAEYISKNLNYPAEELEVRIEGSVKLKFIINKDSIPDRISILQSLSPGCDKEAKRLLREGPKWIPVYIDGELRETELEYSIYFQLEE